MKFNSSMAEFTDCFDSHTLSAGYSIKRANHECVTTTQIIQASDPLRPIFHATRFAVIDEDFLSPGFV